MLRVIGLPELLVLMVVVGIPVLAITLVVSLKRRPAMHPQPNFCAKCGSPLTAGARFCPRCGSAIS